MAWFRAMGGSDSSITFTFNPTNFSSGAPNPTSDANVSRTFTKGTYFNGLTKTNRYFIGNVSSIVRNSTSLSFTCNAVNYGVNFVLTSVAADNTYRFKISNTSYIDMSINCYKSDGTFIGSTDCTINNGYCTFTTPSLTEYCVLNFLGTRTGSCSCSFV